GGALGDADTQPITIVVYDRDLDSGLPQVGVPVYFVAPDGTTQKVISDANGVAAAATGPHTMVVVARRLMGQPDLSTYLEVSRGDRIETRHATYQYSTTLATNDVVVPPTS